MQKETTQSMNLSKLKGNEEFEDSDSWKIQISTEIEHDSNEECKVFNQRTSSRNQIDAKLAMSKESYGPNKYIHQTTSSGNLVLYDSVMRASTSSPQEMLDPNFITNFNNQHMKVYEEQKGDEEVKVFDHKLILM